MDRNSVMDMDMDRNEEDIEQGTPANEGHTQTQPQPQSTLQLKLHKPNAEWWHDMTHKHPHDYMSIENRQVE